VYKAAVIGLGFIGAGDQASGDALGQKVEDLDGTHAWALAAHERVELVAGSSRDEGRRKRFAERMNVRGTYSDWREMLRCEDIDVVSIATYTPWHAEIAIACAEAGVRAVICEKPITTRVRDADRVIDACKKHSVLLAVNHSRRWHPLWRSVREAIKEGTIGQISYLAAHWPSGRLGNVGTHMFDAASFLLDSRPQAVSGTLDPFVPPDCRGPQFHDPGGWSIVRLANGVRLHVDAAARIALPFGFRVFGSLGWIDVGREDAGIQMWSGQTRTIACAPDRPSSLAIGVDEIVTCLAGGGDVSATGEAARDALEVIVAFHVSSKLGGRWVSLPLEGEDRDLEVMSG
jgi:predicted dehydrogenase